MSGRIGGATGEGSPISASMCSVHSPESVLLLCRETRCVASIRMRVDPSNRSNSRERLINTFRSDACASPWERAAVRHCSTKKAPVAIGVPQMM